MLRYLALTALLALPGCFASTVPDAPAVECGWAADGTCPPDASFSFENSSERIDDGATTCWVYAAACTTKPVDAARVPVECKQNQFTTCAPTPR